MMENTQLENQGAPDFQQVKVTVMMTERVLFAYMMANSTFGLSGKIKWGVSIMAIMLLPFALGLDNNMIPMALFAIVLMYMVIQPFLLRINAKRQMLENKVFKTPMNYVFDATGIRLNQSVDSGLMPWENVYQVRETKSLLLFYIGIGQAFIIPKAAMSPGELSEIRMIVYASGMRKIKLQKSGT